MSPETHFALASAVLLAASAALIAWAITSIRTLRKETK